MIPRYAREQMVSIWSPETKFRIWFEIEAHATDKLAELGVVPKDAAKKIWEKGKDAKFDVARIDEIEREVKHDVIAFLTHLSEIVGPEARFVHQGMTSSDVLDTCLNVQLARAADLLIADTDALLAALKKRALEYKMTPTIGRSHGIHAEPTTFGVKLATYYAEFTRARARLVTAREEIATCAISGAVGSFANIDPQVEEHVARQMGLAVEPVSTQVIPRDRHAAFFATLGVVASSLERLAVEHEGRDVVAVSHGGTIRALVAHALGVGPDNALHLSIENLSLTRLERNDFGWRVLCVNELPGY